MTDLILAASGTIPVVDQSYDGHFAFTGARGETRVTIEKDCELLKVTLRLWPEMKTDWLGHGHVMKTSDGWRGTVESFGCVYRVLVRPGREAAEIEFRCPPASTVAPELTPELELAGARLRA